VTARALPRKLLSSSLFLAAAALVVLALAGCVNQQHEVAKYRSLVDGPHPPAIPDYSNGLSLETALLLANRNFEQIPLSGENYLQALIDKDRAYSNFLPTISLAPQVSYTNKNSAGVSSSGATEEAGTGGKTVHTDVPIAGGYQNFNLFGSIYNLYRNAANVDEQRALLFDMQQQVLLETAQTYYAVLAAEQSVLVLRDSVAVQDEALRDMRGRYRAGIADELDVVQIEAEDASTRAQLTAAIATAHTGRQTLEFMIDAPVMDVALVDRLDVPTMLMPMPDALAIGQNDRQDLAAARFAITAAKQNVEEQISAYYPSISLDLDYYLHKETIPTNIEWAGILTANVPIFTGGLLYQNIRTAWSQLRQAWLQESFTSRQVREQVQEAYENVISEQRQLPDLRVAVSSAQEALRQSQQSLNVGLATYLDLLTAQNALLSAQLAYTTDEFNYKTDYLDFLRAMGRLLRPESTHAILSPLHETLPPELITPAPMTAPIFPGTQPATQPLPPMFVPPAIVPATVPSALPPVPPPATMP
jgi:outer membrane protein